MHPSPGSQVHDPVRGPEGLLVVLHHDQGVADVPQVGQGVDEALVVPLVQADGRLVQDVQDPHQGGSDLGGQADPLGLPAREGRGLALQGQVLQPHVPHEGQAGRDLLQDLLGDLPPGVRQVHLGEEVEGRLHAPGGQVVDVDAPHRDGQGLGTEAAAPAGLAGLLGHEAFQPLLDPVAGGLHVSALQVRQDAGETALVLEMSRALPVLVADPDRVVRAVEDGVHDFFGQTTEGCAQGELVMLGQGLEAAAVPGGVGIVGDAPPLLEGEVRIRDDQVRIELQVHPQPRAGRAGSVGIVEGEEAGLQLGQADSALRAGPPAAEELLGLALPGVPDDDGRVLGDLQGRLHALRQAFPGILAELDPVHDDLDAVFLLLLQTDLVLQGDDLAVHPGPDEALLPGVLQDLLVLPLLAPDHGGQDLELGALGPGEDRVQDLVDALLLDLPAALGAVGDPDPGVEETVIIVDLRNRAHRGPGVAVGALLLDGDGRGQALDVVDVGLVHAPQELTGVGGQGLHVAPLSLREDRVEGQGALAGAGEPGDDDQLVPGKFDVYVLQIVFPSALDDQLIHDG